MLGGTSFEPGGDLVIRYNSFADVSTVNTEGNQGLSSKIKILGNILGSIDGSCLPNVTYAYNVIHDDTRCGVDSSLISGPMPYVNADAKAAMNYLVSKGVAADRITIVSFGKERPLCSVSNEACHAQNRRDQFLTKER